MININWLDTGVLVVIVIALVNAIKKATGDKLGYWYMLFSVALGFAVYGIGIYAPEFVKIGLALGLTASGIFDIYSKKGV